MREHTDVFEELWYDVREIRDVPAIAKLVVLILFCILAIGMSFAAAVSLGVQAGLYL